MGLLSDSSCVKPTDLYSKYATGTFPDETMADYSTKGASATHGTTKTMGTSFMESVRGLFGGKKKAE